MRPRHHDDVGRAGPGHHLGLEVSAIHRLEIGDNRHPGKSLAQRPHPVQSLREDQRRAGLEPVDAGAAGQFSRR